MGTRPPRRQPLPKGNRHSPLARSQTEETPTGLSMDTITPIIAFVTFPLAAGAAFVGYIASANSRVIGIAAIISVVTAIAIWALLRSQAGWRSRIRVTNGLLAAIIICMIGLVLTVGGLAAVAPVWIVAGFIVLGAAFAIARPSLRDIRA